MTAKKLLAAIAFAAFGAAISDSALADVIFTGTGTDSSDGSAISATVDFSLSGNTLQIVLTDNDPAMSQGSVLTNLGFTHAPSPAFALPSSSGSVALTAGSSLVSGTTVDTTHTIGQEWAYLAGGLASSGFGIGTGNGNLCGTPGCGVMLDGAGFGMVGTGSNLSLNGLKPANTYIEDSLTFHIILPANSGFMLSQITSVDFQYGTGSGEGDITVNGCTGGSNCLIRTIPEPATWLMMLFEILGPAALTWALRRDSLKAV